MSLDQRATTGVAGLSVRSIYWLATCCNSLASLAIGMSERSVQKHRYKAPDALCTQYHGLCHCGAHEQPEACTVLWLVCWDHNVPELRLLGNRLPPVKSYTSQLCSNQRSCKLIQYLQHN